MPRAGGGFRTHLCYLKEGNKEGTTVSYDSILVVQNFQKMFQEIPGLPHSREIDYVIDLTSGQHP
jgi:hypothetical protein